MAKVTFEFDYDEDASRIKAVQAAQDMQLAHSHIYNLAQKRMDEADISAEETRLLEDIQEYAFPFYRDCE